jgi:hypothetical protein
LTLRTRIAPLVLALVGAACEQRVVSTVDAGPTEPSPNASILPAPLATGLEQAKAGPRDASVTDADADAEPVTPDWQREDRALPIDVWEPHDLSGLVLSARFRWPDVAPPPRLPESSADGIARMAEKTRFDVSAELGAVGRMRLVLASNSFLMPEGTEFRARAEGLGHIVLWPNHERYAVVQAGALRAVLNERRADAEPLSRAKPSISGEGQALGFVTERLRFTTSFGRLDLEQARVSGAGSGGVLLCRFLLEIAGVHPDSVVCDVELVPVRAEYVWASTGRLVFEVRSMQRSTALPPEHLACPPREAEHRVGELPGAASPLFVTRSDLHAMRQKPVVPADARDAGTPKEGLLTLNAGDLTGYVLVDGVPIAHLEARSSDVLVDLVAGSYSIQARDFLATEIIVPSIVSVPARFVVSEAPKSEP